MIKGLDDDEVEFLDLVDRTKLEEERKKNLEEEKEMRDFKAAVASLQEKSLDEKLKQELKNPNVSSKNTASFCGRYYMIQSYNMYLCANIYFDFFMNSLKTTNADIYYLFYV